MNQKKTTAVLLCGSYFVKRSHCCVGASSDKRKLDASEGAAEANSLIVSRDEGRSEMDWRKLMKNAARSRQLSWAAALDSSMSLKILENPSGGEACISKAPSIGECVCCQELPPGAAARGLKAAEIF
jgi:hypothetical protein